MRFKLETALKSVECKLYVKSLICNVRCDYFKQVAVTYWCFLWMALNFASQPELRYAEQR